MPANGKYTSRLASELMQNPDLMREAEARVRRAEVDDFCGIASQPLRWLWPGRIPSGKITLIAGDPCEGKSLLTVDLAARVSTGARFPDGSACERGAVVILSAEDDPSDTIRPRLEAAGANLSPGHVHLLRAVRNFTADGKSALSQFCLQRDTDALEDAVSRTGATLVVIDPISAYLPAGIDSHKNAEIRSLLFPLADVASRHGAAIVAVTHLTKSPGQVIYRIIGSLAFAAAARAVWGVAPDRNEKARKLVIPVKQNLAADTGGLAYRIEAPHGTPRLAWESGAVTVPAEMLLSGRDTEDSSELAEAEEWLRDLLADGSVRQSEVHKRATHDGMAWMTIRRAKECIGIVVSKDGFQGPWIWTLPKDAQPKDAHPYHSNLSTFGAANENKGDNVESAPKDAQVFGVSTFGDGPIPPDADFGAKNGASKRTISEPCHACHKGVYWKSTYGAFFCATCHPPADSSLVSEWLCDGESIPAK